MHTSAVTVFRRQRLILKMCNADGLHYIHIYGVVAVVCLFCPRWNSGAHNSRHHMLFITFTEPFVSLFSINYFPFIPRVTVSFPLLFLTSLFLRV